MTQLALAVSEFLPKVPANGKSVKRPRGRRLDIPSESYVTNAHLALERALTIENFGNRTLTRDRRDKLVSRLSEIVTTQHLSYIAGKADDRDPSQPGWLGTVDWSRSGGVMKARYTHGEFNLLQYLEEQRQLVQDLDVRDLETNQLIIDALMNGRTQTGDTQFDALSNALAADSDFSLMDLFATLKQAMDLTGGEVTEIDDVTLLKALRTTSRNSSYELLGALDYLTLTPNKMREAGWQPGALRYQRTRLLTQPIVRSGSRYFLIRDLLFRSFETYITSLQLADWPTAKKYRRSDLPTFDKALEAAKRQRGSRFEQAVSRSLSDAGIPHTKINKGAQLGKTMMQREIDHVAVHVDTCTIWILEDKDLFDEGTALSARATVEQFMCPGGYLTKLMTSEHDVAKDPNAVAAHVLGNKAQSHRGPWNIRSAFVIRDRGPLGAVGGLSIDVLSASELVGHIKRTSDRI